MTGSQCQKCGDLGPLEDGLCGSCGGVSLRPLGDPAAHRSSMHGVTPLVRSRWPELQGTWLKLESTNESGSFKDRIMRVLVAEAVSSGNQVAVVASSGNAAMSASLHAARRGLRLIVVVPETLAPVSHALLSRFPSLIIRHGAGPADSHAFARSLASTLHLPNLSSTFSSSGAEWGCRSIGHEIADQHPDKRIDTLAASVSVGPVLVGARNGLLEMGLTSPRLVAGQARGCSPIVRAFDEGAHEVSPWVEPVTTKASSIADTLHPYADEATYFLGQVRESAGHMAAGTDEQLLQIRHNLLVHDGVDVELSCCAAIYALLDGHHVGTHSVAILTGSGLRETLVSAVNSDGSLAGRATNVASREMNEGDLMREVTRWMSQ